MLHFKTTELERQFSQDIHELLRHRLYSLVGMVAYRFRKDITVTHLVRTQAQQDEIYKDDKQYMVKKWTSVHQVVPCRGADIRIDGFSAEELLSIQFFLNYHSHYYGYRKPICFPERDHYHIQVLSKEIFGSVNAR